MKKRIFTFMDNNVYRVVIRTEDWSEGDRELMDQFGEPEINVGGTVTYTYNGETKTREFGDEFIRLMHGFPYVRGFDARDYESVDEATAIGVAWKDLISGQDGRINAAITELRAHSNVLPTEEVSEI